MNWITTDCDAPQIQGTFSASSPRSASLEICGLGFFECSLNGEKVGADVLSPVWTDYTPRQNRRLLYPLDDRMRCRVSFLRYDLTLRSGENRLSILLGNGWYTQKERLVEGDLWYGDMPVLAFRLTWEEDDGPHEYVSGSHLRYRLSPIISNNVYTGETQDLRLMDNPGPWKPVRETKGPEGTPEIQTCPPDRVICRIRPLLIHEDAGKRIYDCGRNLTGVLTFETPGLEGHRTQVRYAENLTPDMELDTDSCGSTVQMDQCISRGRPDQFRPRFTWHGFRYVEVQGMCRNPEVLEIHTDMDVVGYFHCSDPVLNHLHNAYVRTRLNNMHCGVPSDCPHRERLGYTGDGQAIASADMYLLDGDLFYRKWIRDILDSQDLTTGHVQHTAPFYGGGGGPGGWGSAVVLVPYAHYVRYRDLEIIRDAWPHMRLFIQYLQSRMDASMQIVREEELGWCLGDWCSPEPESLPEKYVNTCYYLRCLRVMEELGRDLGEDTRDLEDAWTQCAVQMDRLYRQGDHYLQGHQGADALALEAGLGDEAVARAMAERYDQEAGFDTGFLATGSLIRQLFKYGYADTALHLLTSRAPMHSFGWQMDKGATTLWEYWDGKKSQDHPMFGGCVSSLYHDLAGISMEEPDVLRPLFPSIISGLSVRTHTRAGFHSVAWERKDYIRLDITVPVRTTLILPDETLILEKGRHTLMRREVKA